MAGDRTKEMQDVLKRQRAAHEAGEGAYAVTDIAIRDSGGELVAHATATYSIPPRN